MSEQISRLRAFSEHIDWLLVLPALLLTGIGLLTMHTFGVGHSLAPRQFVWMIIAFVIYVAVSFIDMRALRRTSLIMALYSFVLVLLTLLLVAGHTIMGAKSWLVFGGLSFQPADLAKLVLIALLAKYLSRRHVEIADWRHVVVTGIYALLIIMLVLLEPDLGTAVIIGLIWLGLMLVSGISKKHLAVIMLLLTLAATFLWFFGLKPYQRARIVTFVNPAADVRGAGYNAYQAMIAVGSGELFGKGIGYGTQSRLRFLPEYQTDFIFAAYAEEWGFFGVLLLLSLYGILLSRLFIIARHSATNFDAFFTLGVAILFIAHIVVHIGINIGLLPVTGTTIPFMSYGGSHLVMEFAALGVVTSFARFAPPVRREVFEDEQIIPL